MSRLVTLLLFHASMQDKSLSLQVMACLMDIWSGRPPRRIMLLPQVYFRRGHKGFVDMIPALDTPLVLDVPKAESIIQGMLEGMSMSWIEKDAYPVRSHTKTTFRSWPTWCAALWTSEIVPHHWCVVVCMVPACIPSRHWKNLMQCEGSAERNQAQDACIPF